MSSPPSRSLQLLAHPNSALVCAGSGLLVTVFGLLGLAVARFGPEASSDWARPLGPAATLWFALPTFLFATGLVSAVVSALRTRKLWLPLAGGLANLSLLPLYWIRDGILAALMVD